MILSKNKPLTKGWEINDEGGLIVFWMFQAQTTIKISVFSNPAVIV